MELLTVKRLAEKLGVSVPTIYRWTEMKNNPLPHIYKDKKLLFDLEKSKIWKKEYDKTVIRGRKKGLMKYPEEKEEYIKKYYGVLGLKKIAENVKLHPDTVHKIAKKFGCKNTYTKGRKAKKKKYNGLPRYPNDEKFYHNYQISWFLYCQLLAEKKKSL